MVERPQRSEDERPLHMWAPPRPHSGGEEGHLRQPATACPAISPGRPGPGRRLRHSRRRTHTGRLVRRLGGENLSHRHRELSVSPATRPGRRSSRTAGARNPVPCPAERRIQLLCGLAGRRRLSGMRLRHPQLSHGIHQRDQVPGQGTRLAHAVPAAVAGQREQPRRGPQPIPLAGPARNPAVRRPGRPVIPIGRAPQHPAAGRPRRGVQRIGHRPRRVRAGPRITRGAPAQVLRRDGGLPRRVPVDLGAFRCSDPERPGTLRLRPLSPVHLARSRGSVSESCNRPPPYQRGAPSVPAWPRRLTAYPVTSPGLISLNRSRTSRPGGAQPGEELPLTEGLLRGLGDRGPQHSTDHRGRQARCSGQRVTHRRVTPPGPQLRQGQVRRELPAAIPDLAVVLARCARACRPHTRSPHQG